MAPIASLKGLAARLGFDAAILRFAVCSALAASAALLLAWGLGLEHPQWAAMSAWAAAQPLRGQLWAKSGYRMAGTVIGTLVGITLVWLQGLAPGMLVAGLALWLALCTWASNLQRGYLAYGTALAGYTAAMIALLERGIDGSVWALGVDRMATVLTGVAMASLAGFWFAPKGPGTEALSQAVGDLLADLRTALLPPLGHDPDREAALLARIARLEDGLENRYPGAPRSTRAARDVLLAATALLLTRREKPRPDDRTPAVAGPSDVATDPHIQSQIEALQVAEVALRSGDWPAATAALHGALFRPAASQPLQMPRPHRDWIGARQAALRAGGALALIGTLWLLSGWPQGRYLLLGLSIMISLFSSLETPAQIMRPVVLGQGAALLAMLVCRWLVWPQLGSELALVLALIPFILLGACLAAQRRSAPLAFDYTMVFLLLMQPRWPLEGSLTQTLQTAVAVILGPLIAWGLYLLVYPTTATGRRATLLRVMERDLARLARGHAKPGRLGQWRLGQWQARLAHRSLRLIRLQERRGRPARAALGPIEAQLQLEQQIRTLQQAMARPGLPPGLRRATRIALARVSQPNRSRHKRGKSRASLARALRRLQAHAASDGPPPSAAPQPAQT